MKFHFSNVSGRSPTTGKSSREMRHSFLCLFFTGNSLGSLGLVDLLDLSELTRETYSPFKCHLYSYPALSNVGIEGEEKKKG